MSLTIVVPSIERTTIRRTLDSIRNQTIFTEHIVMIDNAKWGAARTRNRALEHVKTDWVGFCDDDDWLDIHYHEWLKQSHADMVIFQMERPEGMILPGHTDVEQLAYNWVGISFALRTDLAKEFLFKDMVGEDYELIQRVKRAGLKLVVSPKVAYYLGWSAATA